MNIIERITWFLQSPVPMRSITEASLLLEKAKEEIISLRAFKASGRMSRRDELLASAKLNADYWLKAARDATDDNQLMLAEQAINAWKNAAYAMADKVVSLEAFKASVDEACNTGNGSYKP